MSQQNKLDGTPTPASTQLPVKRKRGRPRKDKNVVKRENLDEGNDVSESIIGQAITCDVEGSFDAGYIISMKVGNSGKVMRGVVFKPEKITPVTAANDVAPNVRMYYHQNIPIPAANQLPLVENQQVKVEPHQTSSARESQFLIPEPQTADPKLESSQPVQDKLVDLNLVAEGEPMN